MKCQTRTRARKAIGWVLLLCMTNFPAWGRPGRTVEIESGWLRAARADIRIPGDSGTRFSLTGDLDSDADAYVRCRLSWRSAPRHEWLITLVPLEVSGAGRLKRDTYFVNTLFPAGEPVEATYRFNNHRLSYRYRLRNAGRFTADLGGTLFVRDAEVTLRSATLKDSKSDLGLVPLISFGLAWEGFPGLTLALDGDALVAPQGRALDVLLALQYEWNDRLRLGSGYRVLEGGADNDEVYTFALFHHAAVQAAWRF